MGLYFDEVLSVNPSVTAAPCQLPLAREPRAVPARVPPVSISHGSLLRFVLSLTRPVSLLRCSRCIDQSPPCQRGVPRLAEAGGFRRQSLRNFLPIPSSLFTKKPSPFHMGSYFGKVPAVESLSQKSKIFASSLWQGSLWGAATKPPLPKGGGLAKPNRGDSPGWATDLFTIHSSHKMRFPFPHGSVLMGKCQL